MAVHPDVERFWRALESRQSASIGGDDEQHLDGILADDAIWSAGPGGGDVSGKQAIIARWNAFQSKATTTVHQVFADDERILAIVVHTPNNGGDAIRQSFVFEKGADGKVTQFWGMPTDAEVETSLLTGDPVPTHPFFPRFKIAQESRERWTFEPEDIAAIEAFLTEDVRWHGAGNSPWKDGFKGRDHVIDAFKMFKQVSTIHVTMTDLFAGDKWAVAVVVIQAERGDNSDKTLNMPEGRIFRLTPDGRCNEYWGIPDDQDVLDAYWMS